MSPTDQARLARAAALARREILLSLMEAMGPIPPFEYLRKPQKGLIMVRGRVGGTGCPFNLGEALASRCSVRVNGRLGHAYVLGDDPAKALAAAIAAALAQVPEYSARISGLVLALEEEIDRAREREWRKTMETKVDFFTLARGDNDD